MYLQWIASALALSLFLGMLLCVEIGRRMGVAQLRKEPGMPKGFGASESAIFALLGLILAFSFSGAATRFEAHRQLIAAEANAIGTAYLRLDLLPSRAQIELKSLFKHYLDVRILSHSRNEDHIATQQAHAQTAALQQQIWQSATASYDLVDARPNLDLILPDALNAMFDITTTRAVALDNHPPLIVFLLLPLLALVSALLVGFDMSSNKHRRWLHIVSFAAVMSLTVYVIIDLEYPRLGLIRINAADQVLIDLRSSM
ncbi:DUF4239 domain-containing protein [Deefgea sp. CFH1-16]|uniref:bestrophin-like domain n=1 Tax=Deefgea sp. CFH1-16 TaxID=2675457 RepID=UPI0015F4A59D|nr:DUF4239 domain-containing protein [Deefgea sp. CFH1-16]MBM5574461.1 DUF4239 domain-containing protein [Deefgea sp. CFH1-16]